MPECKSAILLCLVSQTPTNWTSAVQTSHKEFSISNQLPLDKHITYIPALENTQLILYSLGVLSCFAQEEQMRQNMLMWTRLLFFVLWGYICFVWPMASYTSNWSLDYLLSCCSTSGEAVWLTGFFIIIIIYV